MCLAVPGKIISIEKNEKDKNAPTMARVDFAGVVQPVCIDWLPDVKEGDYVIVHVGFALNKIDEEEALETLQLLREMGDIH
ncbi:MAG: HypC/HybG/HupF family hydrogenase formation chaperone [Calditrichaeota bacterium]|nr:MAG: HypC/HybG/HupF family hydrogenase formation chaperone [Calditrichota bacterium]